MFERFTADARDVVVRARDEARDLRHDYIGTEHLLLALLDADAGVAREVLRRAGLEPPQVRADITRIVGAPSPPLGQEDAAALRSIGIDLDAVLGRIEATFGPDALSPRDDAPRRGLLRRRGRTPRQSRFTHRAKKVLELALREAVARGDGSIGAEHILLGLLREGRGLAAQVLLDRGLVLTDLRRQVLDALDRAA